MAKKKQAQDGEAGEAEPEAEEGKGSKKKIIMIVVFVLLGAFVGKTMFLKPPPPTEEQVKATDKGEYVDMAFKCAAWNEVPFDAAAVDLEFEHHYEEDNATAPTTVAADDEPSEEGHSAGLAGGGLAVKRVTASRAASAGGGAAPAGPPVLEVEATTINLADDHFLKVGVGLKLAEGADAEAAKTHGTGALARNELINSMTGRTVEELTPPEVRHEILNELGYSVCKETHGGVVSAYFTDFVMQ